MGLRGCVCCEASDTLQWQYIGVDSALIQPQA